MTARSRFATACALLLSALLLTAHADEPGLEDWAGRAAAGILENFDPETVLIVGELHGSRESPRLVNTLVHRLASDGGVVLGLEIPRQEQGRIDAFLRSQGGPRDIDDLLAGNFWQVAPRESDGRRSHAMVDLLEGIRVARLMGSAIDVVALDDADFSARGQDRRQGLADRLVALSRERSEDVLVVLLGNYHARLAPPTGGLVSDGKPMEPPVPTAARLGDLAVTSVNVTACTGSFWACPSPGACGPIELPDRCDSANYPVVERMDEARDGYNLTVTLERMTPSTPALGFAPCDDSAEYPELAGSQCLKTPVPLRHESPGGASIELFVRRVPASEPENHRGEIWLVAGGPGEPGASFHPLLPTFREAFPHHDLVLPDHRGTGASERLCPEQESLDSPDGVALVGEEWGPCIGALHADPERTRAFTITQAAQDLSMLLDRHRGDGEVVLYSVSYGTQLALRMLQVAPVALDGLILDGLVPPESAARWDLSRRTAVVDEVGRTFLGEPGVNAYRRLLDEVDPAAAWREHVPGGDLRRFFGALLNFPTLRTRIPVMIEGLSRGDDAVLRTTAADLEALMEDMTRHPLSPPSLPLVMLISASENNERRELTRETVEAQEKTALFTSPIPGLLVNSPTPLYERDDWFGSVPSSLPRTLVIHGTLDPNTPYEGARAHARILAEAGPLTFSTVDRGAHLSPYVAPTCFVAAASAFVEGAPVPEGCTEPGQEE